METVIIVGGTSLGTALLVSLRKTLTSFFIGKSKYKIKNIKLRKTIEELNYNEFKNIIYEIKNNDIKYELTGYVKAKQEFFFSDNILSSKKIFMLKYDPNYDYKDYYDDRFDKFEKSISKRFNLDL